MEFVLVLLRLVYYFLPGEVEEVGEEFIHIGALFVVNNKTENW